MVQTQRLVKQFVNLVQIDSETRYESEISQYLQHTFRSLDLQVAEDHTAELTGHGSGNLYCTLAATASYEHLPVIFFTCHMDTVAPGKGIKPQIGDDGIIRSNGTTILGSDDKAGIAILIEAIQVLQEQKIPHGQIQFIITVGEEAGLIGARAIDRKSIQAEYGYALDSNGPIGHIATVAPGRAEIHITFYGKSAHAGVNPEDGISAIQIASKAVSRMPLGRIDADTTANIGSFSGIGPLNVVCDRVVIEAEARSTDSHKLDNQIAKMKQACEQAVQLSKTHFDFEAKVVYPSYHHKLDSDVVQLATKAFVKLGIQPHCFQSGGGSDANIFNQMGIPTVNLAIGYQHIHTVKEQIAISDLELAAKAVLKIIEETTSTS